MHKRALQGLFAFILVSPAAWNLWAWSRQPLPDRGGLTTPPDNLGTIATLIDAYYVFQLGRLAPGAPMSALLATRNP